MCRTSGGARCCAIWSFGSVVWLVFVGIIMGSSTPYVRDINTVQEAQIAQKNAFTAAGLWGLTCVIALGMFQYRRVQERRAASRVANDANGMEPDLSAPLVQQLQQHGNEDQQASGTSRRASKKKKSKAVSDREDSSAGTSSMTTI
jgi:hypothetical protein